MKNRRCLIVMVSLLLVSLAGAASSEAAQSVEPLPLLDTFSKIQMTATNQDLATVLGMLPMTDRESVILRARCQIKTTVKRETVKAAVIIKEWPDGKVLWEGPVPFAAQGKEHPLLLDISCKINGLTPRLWAPATPRLYAMALSLTDGDGKTIASKTTRIGFRTIDKTRGGVFQLNGKPLYLRGFAYAQYAPPIANRDKAFALDYVRYLKSKNINTIRVTSQTMLEACDELGMLVFAGFYSYHVTTLEAYREDVFPGLAPHPSVIIYIISNEVRLEGENRKLLEERYAALKAWDPTRLYIGSCGFGDGVGGEIYSRHPYNGWYNAGNIVTRFQDRTYLSTNKPIIFTECVGAYTTEGGTFEIRGDGGKQMGAALRWGGQDLDNPEHALWYQADLAKTVAEWMRLGRGLYEKPNLAGTMPRTPIFFQGRSREDLVRLDQMRPKPIVDALALAYQPVLVSLGTYNRPHVYAGETVETDLWLVNDKDDASDVPAGEIIVSIETPNGAGPVPVAKVPSPALPYYAAQPARVKFTVPADVKTGFYRLAARLSVEGREISRNDTEIFVAQKEWTKPATAPQRAIRLCDASGETAKALSSLGFNAKLWKPADDLPSPDSLLVIGDKAWTGDLDAKKAELRKFVQAGGRVLLLLQDSPKQGGAYVFDWLPVQLKTRQEDGDMLNPQRPYSPALDEITRRHLRHITAQRSFPAYPMETLDHVSVILSYRSGLAEAGLVEVFDGKGTVLLNGLDLVGRVHDDPVAARLLSNLVTYGASMDDHQHSPLITEPILWGDFASEKGIACTRNGLLLNVGRSTEDRLNLPLPVSYPVPDGRRPYGPYTHDKMGKLSRDKKNTTGKAVFHVRVPEDRKVMVTEVSNTGKATAEISFSVNGDASSKHTIPPQKTLRCETAIPARAKELKISIEGSIDLVLRKTEYIP